MTRLRSIPPRGSIPRVRVGVHVGTVQRNAVQRQWTPRIHPPNPVRVDRRRMLAEALQRRVEGILALIADIEANNGDDEYAAQEIRFWRERLEALRRRGTP